MIIFSFLIQILRLFSNSTSTSTTSTSVSTRCTIYKYLIYFTIYSHPIPVSTISAKVFLSFWLKRVLGLVNCYTGISVIHKHTHTRTPRKRKTEIQLSLSNLLFDSLRLFISLSRSLCSTLSTILLLYCLYDILQFWVCQGVPPLLLHIYINTPDFL